MKRQAELIKNFGRDIFADADEDNSRTITPDELPKLHAKFKELLHIEIDFSDDLKDDGVITRFEMVGTTQKNTKNGPKMT